LISPIDALLIIQYLNVHSSGRSDRNISYNTTLTDYDVNGDGNITPLDVLYVINALNSQANRRMPMAEGEWFADDASSNLLGGVAADADLIDLFAHDHRRKRALAMA